MSGHFFGFGIGQKYQNTNDRNFRVHINEGEMEQIRDWVSKYDDIETGGDLFGLWIDDHTAVVQFVLGPGKNCRRGSTSFFQDVDYLHSAGSYITRNHGLCNIGQWHSHHGIKLSQPSAGDNNTLWNNMPILGLDRYIVFIANITGRHEVTVNSFFFQIRNGCQLPVKQGQFKYLDGNSPIRLNTNVLQNVHNGAESFNKITVFHKEKRHTIDKEVKENLHSDLENESGSQRYTGNRVHQVASVPVKQDENKDSYIPKLTTGKNSFVGKGEDWVATHQNTRIIGNEGSHNKHIATGRNEESLSNTQRNTPDQILNRESESVVKTRSRKVESGTGNREYSAIVYHTPEGKQTALTVGDDFTKHHRNEKSPEHGCYDAKHNATAKGGSTAQTNQLSNKSNVTKSQEPTSADKSRRKHRATTPTTSENSQQSVKNSLHSTSNITSYDLENFTFSQNSSKERHHRAPEVATRALADNEISSSSGLEKQNEIKSNTKSTESANFEIIAGINKNSDEKRNPNPSASARETTVKYIGSVVENPECRRRKSSGTYDNVPDDEAPQSKTSKRNTADCNPQPSENLATVTKRASTPSGTLTDELDNESKKNEENRANEKTDGFVTTLTQVICCMSKLKINDEPACTKVKIPPKNKMGKKIRHTITNKI